MADLLDALLSLQPASLWTLAPKPVLLQGIGLMATGDISSVYWMGTDQLVVNFPNRLSTTSHRLRLIGGTIHGVCEVHGDQVCAHHLASLMLALHLLKDVSAFGRFPNQSVASELKISLQRRDARTQLKSDQKADTKQKHVLMRPGASPLFVFRDKSSGRYDDPFAPMPSEIRGFCSYWENVANTEDAFWKWFTDPLRKFPVFIEINQRVLPVELEHTSGWRGEVVLSLDSKGIVMRRHLLQHGEPVNQPVLVVGESFVYLVDSMQLVRLPPKESWVGWNNVAQALAASTTSLMDRHMVKRIASDRNVMEMPVEFDAWNSMNLPWWGSKLAPSLHPQMEWKGQKVSRPESHPARGFIALRPSKDQTMVVVDVGVTCAGAQMQAFDGIVHAESMLELGWSGTSMFSSKARKQAVLSTVFEAALADDATRREALIQKLADDPAFRVPEQSLEAQQMVRRFFEDIEEGVPRLFASPEHGWIIADGSARPGMVAGALARHVLGAMPVDELSYAQLELIENEGDAQLAMASADALARLPLLMAECQARGIDITFASKPVQMTKLDCSVSAEKQGSLDFFELKPEVVCNGTLIPQEQWESIVLKGHLMDDEGNMLVVDVNSLRSLDRVTDILTRQRGEAGRSRDGRDKEHIHIPRVRILDWLMLQKDGIECKLPEEERAVLESLLAFEALGREPLPAVKATLRDYQHTGYSWLAFLYKHGFGACLADDMGLGKTLQTITLLAAIKEGLVKPLAADGAEKRAHLIVVPPTLLFNWQNEIKTFCPGIYVHEYTGKGRSLTGINEGVVLTTYELVRRDIEKLKERKFDCIIFDEAQAVKNMLGERSKAMRQLTGRFKLALTGTPLENHAGEYFSIIELALPGIFGDYTEFMTALKRPGDGGYNPLDRARPFVLRRTKEKILKELPPKVESDLHLDLTEEQKRFYTRAVADVRAEVLAAFKDKTAQQAGIVALAALTRLRQICVSPALIDPAHQELSPKIEYLIEKVRELGEEGHAALVFSQFTKSLDLLEVHLKSAGIAFQRLDGSTPQQHRKTLVEAFQSGRGPGLFLISLKAGGAGLNLTRASYVFHLDPWWNPAVENQASDRAHRMGQTQTVFIQRLLMRHTIEEKIMQLKAIKKELFDRVLAGNESEIASTGAVITKEDLSFLLG